MKILLALFASTALFAQVHAGDTRTTLKLIADDFTDNTPALTAALSHPGRYFLPPGVYSVKQIVIGADDVVFYSAGAPKATVLKAPSGVTNFFVLNAHQHVTCVNLTFDISASPQAAVAPGGAKFERIEIKAQ